MRFGRARWHWYDIILLVLAAIIVYPDKILEWLSESTGRAFGWLHLVGLEAVAIALMIAAMLWLMPMNPKLVWWHPVMYVGMLATFRAIMWGVTRMFGFDDW